MDSEKYAKFDITEVTYKVVNNQDIKAYTLTPKGIAPGHHPVVAKFHGGFFISGASLYPDWYPRWMLEYCLLHSAIIVTGDYRLLPESTGTDMYEDILDFWHWIRGDLQAILNNSRPGVQADLSKIIVHGESAGGTISLLSGFSQPKGFIKAVIAMYPGIDLMNSTPRDKPILGFPTFPPSILEDHLKSMKPGKIVTSAFPPERATLMLSAAQQGRLGEFFGGDERLDLDKVLSKAEDMPYTLILHGREDSAVPVADSIKWTEKATRKFGAGKIDLHLDPGEHGFDAELPLSTPWLQGRLVRVTELWLGEKEE